LQVYTLYCYAHIVHCTHCKTIVFAFIIYYVVRVYSTILCIFYEHTHTHTQSEAISETKKKTLVCNLLSYLRTYIYIYMLNSEYLYTCILGVCIWFTAVICADTGIIYIYLLLLYGHILLTHILYSSYPNVLIENKQKF